MFQKLFRRGERGQMLVLVAGLLPALVGMTGIAVDAGSYASDRRSLQNSADSIALAAAQDLPNSSAATTTAQAWAVKNNVAWSNVTFTVSGGNVTPTVTVQIARNHDFSFMRILGVNTKSVSSRAVAVKVSFGGSNGIVPWSVTQATINSSTAGALITMKYDATGGNTGNFGAIQIDGPGSNTYNTSVKYGSNTFACAATAPNCTTGACPGAYPNVCAETAPECNGPDCSPQTGNMTGPTRTGVDFRMNNTSAACDTFAETFTGPDANGKYHLTPNCNPYVSGPGECTTPTMLCSRRVIIIPVINAFGNGSSTPVTIQRFAMVYLEGYTGTCTGNSCDVQGRFVNADLTTSALAGSYDPTALIHFAKLSE